MGVQVIQLTSDSHHENLLASLHELRLQGQLSDVTVQVDYQGVMQEFQAHQVMLAASSGYFKKILLSQDAARDKLSLSNMPSNDFSRFLEFVYTGRVEVARDKIGDVLQAAQFLDCEDLAEVCGRAMSAGILQNPAKKTSESKVVNKDDLYGAKNEKSTKGKKQPKSLVLKRRLSPQSSEKEVISKRCKAKNTVKDKKRQGGKMLKLSLAGRKVLQRRLDVKKEDFNNENQVGNVETDENEVRTEAEAQPENREENGSESLMGMPISDADVLGGEEDEQGNDAEDALLLSLDEEEEDNDGDEDDDEGQPKDTIKRTSRAQFQCNKCQRTFHYEKSYLKHIR